MDCPICQSPPVECLEIPPSLVAELAKEVEGSASVETGGVLIGYLDGRKAIVTHVTGPGPNAIRTATRLERDVDYTQKQIEQAQHELGVQGVYIGEWHSHLEPDPEPSGLDIRSMMGIAAAPNYATTCPAMVIVGFDPKTLKSTKIKAWVFPQQGKAHSIQIDSDSAPVTVVRA